MFIWIGWIQKSCMIFLSTLLNFIRTSMSTIPYFSKSNSLMSVWSMFFPYLSFHWLYVLNVKELLDWKRHNICKLSDYNNILTHNHLVCKQTLNYIVKFLARWSSVCLQTKWLWVWILLQSLNFQISCCSHLTFRYHSSFEQRVSWHSGNYKV